MKTRLVCTVAAFVGTLLSPAACRAESVTVDPARCVIVLPAQTNTVTAVAVRELQKHLRLVTNKEIPTVGPAEGGTDKYAFCVGIAAPGDDKPLASEEARWVVGPRAAWLYGNDLRGRGTQFAVYGFLEQHLGVRWVEPGDVGISFAPQNPLKLETGRASWAPKLMFRSIRQGLRADDLMKLEHLESRGLMGFKEFLDPVEKHNAFVEDVVLWRARMRMGGERPGGGHSFATWWPKYGKTHPEYFALNRFGKREPVFIKSKGQKQSEEFVKDCSSCPGVVDQVIKDWLPRKAVERYVGADVNDGGEDFCECAACRALDVTRPGEKWQDHLTDRYVYLANAVARKVREIDPDAWVTSYAYLNTFEPPRKLGVEPNIVVHIIPYVTPLDTASVGALFKGWHDAGATKLALRPNYHTKYNTGVIPIGHEKQMFDVFQVAVRYGAVSADYDSLIHNWPVTGMADYVLAKAMAEPDRSFEHWEEEYCRTYGAAADVVKQYFRYWREELWEKRLVPKMSEITAIGGAGDFVRGLMWSLGSYYQPSDFEKAAAILKEAEGKPLSTGQKDRLNQLVLANQHARLVYDAVVPKGLAKCGPAQKLMEFRKRHQHDLRLRMLGICRSEVEMGDITGLRLVETMAEYLPPWVETEVVWRFRLDPQNVGLDQKWAEKSWDQTADWDRIRTDQFWENQAGDEKLLSAETRAKLPAFDGIAWYTSEFQVPPEFKGRRVFLRFGAVDESCWVYVNGKPAGQHLYEKSNDWKTPFEIQIDPHVEWAKPQQVVTVRVEDKGGNGGIWRPVWIVSRKP